MLPPGKVAVFLLLVCIMACPDEVISKNPICTKKQREKILEVCDYFIQPGYPIRLVSWDSPCCAAVREVRDRDMECIIIQLTKQEMMKYSVEKIQALHRLCELPPPSPNHQVIGTCTMQQKETVLDNCKKFIKHGNQCPKPIPIMGQPCCNAVKVPKKGTKIDMQCVVNYLLMMRRSITM
ncbi:hypothetical protein C2845_PM18G03230 [Panicum miliaceum]|uniref:Bifunctional inhibitor/plant lipid transfer protein/seed storage helical domain-containing protein n=1 Tax=Panicum miliaceum TaxID=4540 RepID=A0A3L6PMW4_PANMI|nr:hypothetical protein C2845_PM18G03230 [Panicum miliaceum]